MAGIISDGLCVRASCVYAAQRGSRASANLPSFFDCFYWGILLGGVVE
jgi:hypothetical protein